MPFWTPPQRVRPMAIGLAWRGAQLLVFRVHDAAGRLTGVRPLGGEIEFGEAAPDALAREFREELGAEIAVEGPPLALENLYEHDGVVGHELMLIYPIRLVDDAFTARDRLPILDAAEPAQWAEWIELAELGPGGIELYPAGLLERLGTLGALGAPTAAHERELGPDAKAPAD